MQHYYASQGQLSQSPAPHSQKAADWQWLDFTHTEVATDANDFVRQIQAHTHVTIQELHIQDATNLNHPSHHDRTPDYDMVVFRKLSTITSKNASVHAPLQNALRSIQTRPVTFFIAGNSLITVRAGDNPIVDALCQKMQCGLLKAPDNALDMVLRLLNALVDAYLELRHPMTEQLDRWQRRLLDPAKPFRDWMLLLDARLELRKLEALSEEQIDALQELQDSLLDNKITPIGDTSMVRLRDVIEHTERVLNHARRLETSVESAIQLHFAASSHETNALIKRLSLLTAVFAPLTLITGVFGMNFEFMPLLKNPIGFWITIGFMVCLCITLIFTSSHLRSWLVRWRKKSRHLKSDTNTDLD